MAEPGDDPDDPIDLDEFDEIVEIVEIVDPDDPIDPGVSEFGEMLADFVRATPQARGAVLSDGVDDTIDTAHRPGKISALDVCIAGAQVGQAMARMTIDTIIFGLGRAVIVLEGDDMTLIAKQLWEQYLLTAVLDANAGDPNGDEPRADLARTLRDFEDTGARVLALLK